MRTIIAAMLVVSCSACAADFSARVAEGNEAIATPEGEAYDASLAPTIHAAIVACIPPGPSAPGQTGKFALVGVVDSYGKLSSVRVEPTTTSSRCFADKLSSSTLPPAPTTKRWGHAYPLTVEMTIQ